MGGTSAYVCGPGSSAKPAALLTILEICPLVMLACGLKRPSGNPETTPSLVKHLIYEKNGFDSGTSGKLISPGVGVAVPVAVSVGLPTVAVGTPVDVLAGVSVAVAVDVFVTVFVTVGVLVFAGVAVLV